MGRLACCLPSPRTLTRCAPARRAAYHYLTFFVTLGGGLLFLALLLYFTGDINFQRAVFKVLKRLYKTIALRQLMGILSAMTFVR